MGRAPKNASMLEGNLSKEEREKRVENEKKIQGESRVQPTPPSHLDNFAKAYYREIIKTIPSEILNFTDTYYISVCADALSKMKLCQQKIAEEGMIVEYTNKAGFTNINESKYVGIYHKYAGLLDKFGAKIGLSASDRAKISIMQITEEKDEVLELLNM